MSVASTLAETDWLRRSASLAGGPRGHKEWWHFCAYGPEVDVLVNFSLVDDVREGSPPGAEFARVTLLARDRGWDGDVDLYPADEVAADGGGLSLRFGDNVAEFRDGAYRLRARARRRPIEVDLTITPTALPSLANNITLDPGPPINWLVVPRGEATGTVTVGGRAHALERAPAYHDHNWGRFAWGRDFAWEWGFGLPQRDEPWSVVFVRLSDRARTLARMQALFLWRGARQHRVMRGSELTVTRGGLLRPERVLKVPRVMGLVSPSTATDVPARLEVEAVADGDRVECVFTASDLAQVVIPNDHDAGVTIINEVSGAVRVEGEVRGERVRMEGRAIFEFLGA